MSSVSHFTTQRAIAKETQELSLQILKSVNDPESRVGEETAVSIPPTWPQVETTTVDGKTSCSFSGTEVNP